MNSPKILIVDDDDSIRWVLEKAVIREQIIPVTLANAEKVLETIEHEQPDVVISDIRMPGIDGFKLLQAVQQAYPKLPVIIMTAHSDLDTAVAAFKNGAFEYLPKPFDIEETLAVIQRAIRQSQKDQPAKLTSTKPKETEILGEAPAMQQLFRALGRLSRSEATVLLIGESGTGKELVAEALHKHSVRSAKPFIALNMAAIPKELVESELFGHEKGAFTGATQRRVGRFEQAHLGTLFLDEIGDMPLETQTRLLRVLAEGQFYRVGGHVPIKVDVRVIAATHQNLQAQVKDGVFREDLYHRLNVIRLNLPRLAERSEDIALLAEHFLDRAAKELSVSRKHLTVEAITYLNKLDWPGNVRQLENVCRWLTVMVSANEVQVTDLPDDLQNDLQQFSIRETNKTGKQDWQQSFRQWIKKELSKGTTNLYNLSQNKIEVILIDEALEASKDLRQLAAQKLGWGRNTLTRKIKKHARATSTTNPTSKKSN